MFYKKIDLRSTKAMKEFLSNHFRYYTMNSWNLSTSYAHNLKIHNVIPGELQDKAYELLDTEYFYSDFINQLINEFNINHSYEYQAGFNGRSGGYLVLSKGGQYTENLKFKPEDPKDARSYSDVYGRWISHQEAIDMKIAYHSFPGRTYSHPGKSIDQNEDFEDWDLYSLKDRVKLVQEFDQLCDDIVAETIYACKNFKVEEKEIKVSMKIKVLVEKGGRND